MPGGTFDLSTLNGQNGFVINGVTPNDQSGWSASGAGDVNDDGVADILIGAYFASPGGNVQAGTSYVVFGKRGSRNTGTFDLATLNGTNGFAIPGLPTYIVPENSGYSVSSAGDINGDGIADILISAFHAGPNGKVTAGRVYVIFGNSAVGSTGTFDLLTLNGTNGFVIPGLTSGDVLGISVSTAGDVNGDGIADMIIGASGASSGGVQAGASYVIFGNSIIGNTGTFDLSTLDGTSGFVIYGVATNDFSGCSVNFAGDVNADGVADILIGAYGTDPSGKPLAGTSYVIFGKRGSTTPNLNLSSLNGTHGFSIPGFTIGAHLGISTSSAGDVNNDGIADILLGSPLAGPHRKYQAGITYVIFGRAGIASTGIFNLSTLSGINGFSIPGLNANDQIGYAVSKAGDVNGDGIEDILLGTGEASPGGRYRAGTSYVIFGKPDIGNTGVFDLSSLNGTNGFILPGLTIYDQSGLSVSNAEDVNGDGVTDIIIGAPYASPNENTAAGISYVVYGSNHVPQLLTNQFSLNQGETRLLTVNNLNATDSMYSRNELSFNPVDVNHGYFQLASNSGAPVTGFSQSSVDAGQIQFVHDGSSNIPSYSISVSNLSPIPSYPQAASISFNFAPVIVNNNLTIHRGERILLSTQDLSAMDRNDAAANLIFSISNVQYGQFNLVSQPGASIYSFLQNQITSQQVQFTQDGSLNTPHYAVSVSDGRVSNVNGPQVAMIHFDAGNPNIITNPSNSTAAIVGGVVGTSVGVIALVSLSAIYTRNKSKQTLEQAIETSGGNELGRQSEFRRNVFYPIAKKIYAQMKISNCMGQLSKKTAENYVRAIQALIEELQKQGVDLDLEKMAFENQQQLMNEIVRHIRFYAIPNSSMRCSRFFKAEVTPTQIEDKAHAIAQGVANVINSPQVQVRQADTVISSKKTLAYEGNEKNDETEMASVPTLT